MFSPSIQLCQRVPFLNGYQFPDLPRVGSDLLPERNLCYASIFRGFLHEAPRQAEHFVRRAQKYPTVMLG